MAALLDDPDARDRLVAALADGETTDEAAARLGISRRAVSKYAAKHPDFAVRLDAARGRRKVAEQKVPRIVEPKPRKRPPVVEDPAGCAQALAVPVELVQDADRTAGPTVTELLELCWAIACDPEHRAGGQALRILAEYKLGPVVRAQQRAEEREEAAKLAAQAEGSREAVVLIELPRNGTEAPGYEPMPRDDVLDVEVVDA